MAQNGIDVLLSYFREPNNAEDSEGQQLLNCLVETAVELNENPETPVPEVVLETPGAETASEQCKKVPVTSTSKVTLGQQEPISETLVAEVNPVPQKALAPESDSCDPTAVEAGTEPSALVPPENPIALEGSQEEADLYEEPGEEDTWPWAGQVESLSDMTLTDEDAGYQGLEPFDPRYVRCLGLVGN